MVIKPKFSDQLTQVSLWNLFHYLVINLLPRIIYYPQFFLIDWDKNWSDLCQKMEEKRVEKVYSTRYSQAVTHPSTNRARRRLTLVIRREPVFSTWYGRRHRYELMVVYLLQQILLIYLQF